MSPADQERDGIIYVVKRLVRHGITNTVIHMALIDVNFDELLLNVKDKTIITCVIACYMPSRRLNRVGFKRTLGPVNPVIQDPYATALTLFLRLPSTGRSHDKRITEHLKPDPIHECLITISRSLSRPEIIEIKHLILQLN